jgi:hypothetical protein
MFYTDITFLQIISQSCNFQHVCFQVLCSEVLAIQIHTFQCQCRPHDSAPWNTCDKSLSPICGTALCHSPFIPTLTAPWTEVTFTSHLLLRRTITKQPQKDKNDFPASYCSHSTRHRLSSKLTEMLWDKERSSERPIFQSKRRFILIFGLTIHFNIIIQFTIHSFHFI